jgi:hypothetical protein
MNNLYVSLDDKDLVFSLFYRNPDHIHTIRVKTKGRETIDIDEIKKTLEKHSENCKFEKNPKIDISAKRQLSSPHGSKS